MSSIEELIQRQTALKEKILLDKLGTKHHKFGDILFYENMSFFNLDDAKLILAHAYLHKSYTLEKPELSHKVLKVLHNKIKEEFSKRGFPHSKFDELDDF